MSSTAAAYEHYACAQMYTHHYPYMPGDYYYRNNPDARYAYSRDDPAADELYDLAEPLMTGKLQDEEEYWNTFQELLDRGVEESVRSFVMMERDLITMNKENVSTDLVTDNVAGWSQIFSPRTVKTRDAALTAAQYDANGDLYTDNWNNIAGSWDYNGQTQQKISRDYATTTNPVTGVPMGMRAEWTEVTKDYEYDVDGNLIKNISIPDNVVNYDVFTEEWTEGYGWTYSDDEGNISVENYSATAVTYDWHFGTWHSGHNFDMQDLVAYFAFSKQLCWDTPAGGHYYVGSWANNRLYYNNILGIVFDEANDTVTIYGDYTNPNDPQVGNYYTWMPEVPWQQYEAASQLIGMTVLAPPDPLNNQSYSWSDQADRNWVHWLSSEQGYDFNRTLQNMVDTEFVPPYLDSSRNSPIPLTPGDDAADIQTMQNFYGEYEHFWITHGPFKITLHDPVNMVLEYERWAQTDGYPFPQEYWDEVLDYSDTFSSELTAGGGSDGWNFVSFNLELEDTTLTTILADIDGSYDRLMYYCAAEDEWKTYVPGRAEHFNHLDNWDRRMGIWIKMNTDATLMLDGYQPIVTDITLYPGWNMVGLPSETAGNHGLPSEVTKIGYFASAEEYNLAYDTDPANYTFEPGQGYWIYNDAEEPVIWSVSY